ncbi:SAF domain-containing protein [Arthrobacter sp. H20]|uniref:SAF domain-containing protein n=1 Tax=Arthrobacter sp. H20 TaxID=1267981 RepID=UPI00047BC12C|nr:SAF domain-containing protein [Arthrobacter sp. H20]
MSLLAATPERDGPPVRLRKPSWKDPRLLVGLLLVLASVAAVTALLGNADQTTDVYAARSEIPVGGGVTPEDLTVVAVRLGDLQPVYLRVEDGVPVNAVATTVLRAGELVPRATLGTADVLDRKPIGLTVDDPLPTGTTTGSRVDVWVSFEGDDGTFEPPTQLLEAAEISELAVAESALGGSGGPTLVHVLVGDDKLPELLDALLNEARIAIVLNPGGSP